MERREPEQGESRFAYLKYLRYSWAILEMGIGLVGSVIAGVLLGGYLDRRAGSGMLYTGLLAVAGVAFGLFNAYKGLRALEQRLRR